MKMNWGTSIVIVIGAFMAFILYFVIKISSDKKYNHDLVSEKYYEKELVYQQDINAVKNGKSLKENIKLVKESNGLKIVFPATFDAQKITGKVFLYRPSNKHLDFEIPISISKTYLLVPEKRLLGGRWNISVVWKYNQKDYLFKEAITY